MDTRTTFMKIMMADALLKEARNDIEKMRHNGHPDNDAAGEQAIVHIDSALTETGRAMTDAVVLVDIE